MTGPLAPRGRPDACSALWDADDTSAWGTAARATFVVGLEQPGSWGRNAVTDSGLDPGLGSALDAAVSAHGGRLMLVRRPGRHADRADGAREVLIGACAPRAEQSVGVQLTVSDPAVLLDVDWHAVADGDLASLLRLSPRVMTEPVLLVCTNGTRDVCCAVRGRPVALDAATDAPDQVWEVSHTGGHRFAPTAVLLPWGLTVARLDAGLADELLAMSLSEPQLPEAMLGTRHDRGRACLSPAEQAAESAVRAHTGERELGAMTVTDAREDDGGIEVVHRDGRRWLVTPRQEPTGVERPESCGKGAKPVRAWGVDDLREVTRP